MHNGQRDHFVRIAPAASVSRRTVVSWAARLAAGAALSVIAGARLVRDAEAQDNEIILTATASEVGARPGSAYAQGAAALATADQDATVTTAAATIQAVASADGGTSEDAVATGCGPRC
jgi:hypothetical protein